MAKRKPAKRQPVTTAPAGGVRIGGKFYKSGQPVPVKYGRILPEGQVSVDPALSKGGDVAPNFGRMTIPQVFTFSGRTSTVGNVYRNPDEAVRQSVDNARFMRNDAGIMECLEARQRSTALLNWHIEPDDKDNAQQVELAEQMTKIIEATPNFTEYRRNLLEALWYGRYAVQHAYGMHERDGKRFWVINDWEPINGDKLVFGFDDDTGRFRKNRVGIKVTPAFRMTDALAGDRKLDVTEAGQVYFLEEWERSRIAIHKHIIEDGVFEDPLSAGRINGVGIRDRIYWTWYQKQETMAHMMEIIERTGSGFTIYWYPDGDPKAKEQVEAIAQEGNRSNVLLMPRMLGEDSAYGVDRVEPNAGGVEMLRGVINDFFAHQIKRYILGQILSSESAGTGLGSGVADLHKDTYAQIIQYDAIKLEETITNEVLLPLRNINFPKLSHIPLKFRIDTESSDAEKKMAAYRSAWEMGCSLKAADVMDIIGASMPTSDDIVLVNPSMVQQNRLWQKQQASGQAAGSAAGSLMRASDLFGDALDENAPDEDGDQQQESPQGPQKYAKEDETKTADDKLRARLRGLQNAKDGKSLGCVRDYWPRSKDISQKAANAEVIFRPDFLGTVYCYPSRIVIGAGAVRMLGNRNRVLGQLFLQSAKQLSGSFGIVAKYAKAMTYEEITAVANETEEPSEAQKEAGNYAKGKFRWKGLPITIETAAGCKRNPEWKALAHHYGYINSTESRDGDQVDVFIGPNPESDIVFVVDQVTASGRFDEHKCMLGFTSLESATAGYLANYSDGWKLGPVTPMTIDQFKAWLQDGETQKPVAAQVSKYAKQMTLWEEKEHPRDNSGEFTSKGQGSGSAAESTPEPKAEAPAQAPQVEPQAATVAQAAPTPQPAKTMQTSPENRDASKLKTELATKARGGDKSARNQLITAYMPLIKHIVSKSVRNKKSSFDDMVQEASIALNNAVDKWDPAKGDFPAYADTAIRNAANGVNRKEWKHDKRKAGQESDDFNANDIADGDRSNRNWEQFQKDSDWAAEAIKQLPERWQHVINGRLSGTTTYEQMAAELKVDTSRIGQIYNSAIAKLKEMHKDRHDVIDRYFKAGILLRYAALPVPGNAVEAAHQVGETMSRNGTTYRLNQNHRWELADKNKGAEDGSKSPETSTAVDTKSFAAKSLGTVTDSILSQTLGAFHGVKGKGGLSGKKVRGILQQALQSGGDGQGPTVDLGNGQTTQAVKAHGGLVVDLGQGRIGFASSAGSIVIHQATDGQAKLTFAHNTGLVRDAMKKGQADTQEQPASTPPTNDPNDEFPGAEPIDMGGAAEGYKQGAQDPEPIPQPQQGPKQRWRVPKGGLGAKPAPSAEPQAAPPATTPAAPTAPDTEPTPESSATAEQPAAEPQPAGDVTPHIALRREANKASRKVDRLTEKYAEDLAGGQLTSKQDLWHRLNIRAHKTLATHAERRAREAEKVHATAQKEAARQEQEKAKAATKAERERLKTETMRAKLEAAQAKAKAKAEPKPPKPAKEPKASTPASGSAEAPEKSNPLLDAAQANPGGYKELDPTDPNYRKPLGDKLREAKEQKGRESMLNNVDKHLTEAGLQANDKNRDLVKRALTLSDNDKMEGYIRDSGQLKNMLAKAKSLHQEGGDEHEALKKAVDFRSHLKPKVDSEKVMKENADAWGMPADEYKQVAGEYWKEIAGHQAEREAARKTARGLLGLNSSHLKGDGDYASGNLKNKKWDVYADEVARQHPELGWQVGDHNNEQRLWDLVGEGANPAPEPHEDEYHDAVHQHLASLYGDSDEYRKWRLSGGHQEELPSYEPDLEGAIPFAKSGFVVRYEAMRERHRAVVAKYAKHQTE